MDNKVIYILGEQYTIKRPLIDDDAKLRNGDGYCDDTTKTLVVENFIPTLDSKGDLDKYADQVLRHEIIHAFLCESGLSSSCNWAVNETMVDYFAIQFPKMIKAMKEADCL